MRVFVIDEQPIFREGLKRILQDSRDLTVVGEAFQCKDVSADVLHNCDLLTLDGELDSLALLQKLDRSRPRGAPPHTFVLTRHTEDQHAVQMLAAGADGYMDKSKPAQTVLDAIVKVAQGGKYVGKELAETVLFNFDKLNRPTRLSGREYQVLCLFASGLGMKEIAGKLSLSVKTISTYRCRLLEKLNLSSNAQLMRYAFKEGVVGE